MQITDDLLSAFIDGELSAEDTRAIETQVASDPVLAERVHKLKSVDSALAGALTSVIKEPVPDNILQMVSEHEYEAKNNLTVMQKAQARSWFRSPLAVAAAAAFGLVLGTLFNPAQSTISESKIYAGNVEPGTNLFAVLETVPSNISQNGLTPLVSFVSVDEGICREFVSENARALACRQNEAWTVLAINHEARTEEGETYETASANASIIFDILAQELMRDGPLSPDEERSLIEQNWSSGSALPE